MFMSTNAHEEFVEQSRRHTINLRMQIAHLESENIKLRSSSEIKTLKDALAMFGDPLLAHEIAQWLKENVRDI